MSEDSYNDVSLLILVSVFIVLPAVLSITVGRLIDRRSRLVSVLVCGLSTPAICLILGVVAYHYEPRPEVDSEAYDMWPFVLTMYLSTATLLSMSICAVIQWIKRANQSR
jgi:hypothetical protein